MKKGIKQKKVIDIVIRDRMEKNGETKTVLSAGKMSYEELFSLGSLLGKLLSSQIDNRISAMTVLDVIHDYAARQLIREYGRYYTDEELAIAGKLRDDYILEQDKKGRHGHRNFLAPCTEA